MIKLILNFTINPKYYIEDLIERYGNIVSIFLFEVIIILYMFLNTVIYDKSLGNTLIALKKSTIESCFLGGVIGLFILFFTSIMLKYLYNLLGIKATLKTIRNCITWGSVPLLLGNLISVVIRVMIIYNVDTEIMFRPYLWSSIPILLITILTIIWSIKLVTSCMQLLLNCKQKYALVFLFVSISITLPLAFYLTDKLYFYITIYLRYLI